jgi:predicted secreted hydrolase
MRSGARGVVVAFVGAAAIGGLLWLLTRPTPLPPVRATLSVAEALAGGDTAGFMRVTGPRTFSFPADHGAHPAYRTEWWYFTGNVDAADGRRFGYQLTLFRNAVSAAAPPIDSDWATNQVWMAHLAVTDVAAGEFHGFERFARGAAGLAGATNPPLRVWLEDWQIVQPGEPAATPESLFPLRLRAVEDGTGIDLLVHAAKPMVLQGESGYSRKGVDRGNASHYYSFTRLTTSGTVYLHGDSTRVLGESWLDREWSTSALDAGQAGWDWFALQLDDGTDLMYYQLRREDGSADVFSRGSFVDATGAVRTLHRGDVQLVVHETWTSPRGGTYPARWTLRVPGLDIELVVVPVLADQEHDTYVRYWEGAVDARGERSGASVAGRGYVELTGYAADPR